MRRFYVQLLELRRFSGSRFHGEQSTTPKPSMKMFEVQEDLKMCLTPRPDVSAKAVDIQLHLDLYSG
jgi:hypothetical protein